MQIVELITHLKEEEETELELLTKSGALPWSVSSDME